MLQVGVGEGGMWTVVEFEFSLQCRSQWRKSGLGNGGSRRMQVQGIGGGGGGVRCAVLGWGERRQLLY